MNIIKRLLVTAATAAGALALITAPPSGAAEQPAKGDIKVASVEGLRLLPARSRVARSSSVSAQAVPQNAYLISSVRSGRCLDADLNALSKNGTKVQLWDCDPYAANQAFYITQNAEGYLRFKNVASGRYLDADRNSMGRNGTKVQLWDLASGAKTSG